MRRLVIFGFGQHDESGTIGGLGQGPGGGVDEFHVFHIRHGSGVLDGIAGGITGLFGNQGERHGDGFLVEAFQGARDQAGAQHFLGFPADRVAIEGFRGIGGLVPVAQQGRFGFREAQPVQIDTRQILFALIQWLAQAGEPGVRVQALGKGLGLVEQRDFFEQARNVRVVGIIVEVHAAYLAICTARGQG